MEKSKMCDILHDNCPGHFRMINVMKNKLARKKWGTVQDLKRLKKQTSATGEGTLINPESGQKINKQTKTPTIYI